MTIVSDRSIGNKALGLVWLSFASGCTDVLSFLEFGDVFTSAMTGNTALLAIAIGRDHLLAASHSLTALLGFAVGVMLAAALSGLRDEGQSPRKRLGRLLLVEHACLGGCAALWIASSASFEGGAPYAIILLSAVSMGIQGVAARVMGSTGISTIVFTSVLISIVTSLTSVFTRHTNLFGPRKGIRTHVGTFAAYTLGGLLVRVLVTHSVELLVWVPMIAVVLAFGCSYLPGKSQRSTP